MAFCSYQNDSDPALTDRVSVNQAVGLQTNEQPVFLAEGRGIYGYSLLL